MDNHKYHGKLQVEVGKVYIYSMVLEGKTKEDILTACAKTSSNLKGSTLVKDPTDKTIYMLKKNDKIMAYFWWI